VAVVRESVRQRSPEKPCAAGDDNLHEDYSARAVFMAVLSAGSGFNRTSLPTISLEGPAGNPFPQQRVDDDIAIAFAADDIVSPECAQGSLDRGGAAEPVTLADVS
jgi:hypothetical protein